MRNQTFLSFFYSGLKANTTAMPIINKNAGKTMSAEVRPFQSLSLKIQVTQP